MSVPNLALVLLFALQVVTILGLIALARQVGILLARVHPVGAGPIQEGPPIGSQVSFPPIIRTFRGRDRAMTGGSKKMLVVMASPTCSLCGPVLEGVVRLGAVQPEIDCVIAVDEEGARTLQYLDRHGVDDAIPTSQIQAMDPGPRPFALVLDQRGTVLGSGVVNSLEQVEELLVVSGMQSADMRTVEPSEVTDDIGGVGMRPGNPSISISRRGEVEWHDIHG